MSFDELESKFRSLQQENHSLRQRLRQGKTQFSMVLESLHEQEQRHQEDEEEAEELRSMVNEANAQTADVLEENYSLRAELKHWSDRRKQKNIRRKPGVCALNLEEQKLSSQPHCMSPLERQLLHVQRQTSPTPGPSPPPLTPDLPEVESPTSVAPPPPPSSGSQSVDPPDYFYQQIERSGQFSFTAKSEASVEPVPSRRNAVSISQESDIARSLHELSLKVNGPSLELSAPRPSSRPDELTPPATPPFLEAWMRNSGILERIREEDEGDARYALQKAHGGDSRIGAWDAPAQ
ncbi:MAG: hypothetical protein M1831_005719 [Alyxoria varia]|nr:MAG: hypothetical protein M1831_005719 [Alyxoria varia]